MTLTERIKEAYVSRKARAEVLYTLWQQMGHLALVEEQIKLAEALIVDINTCIAQLRDAERKGKGNGNKVRQLKLDTKPPQ